MELIDFLKTLARPLLGFVTRPPRSVDELWKRGLDIRSLAMSWSAMQTRRLGSRAIIIIGIGASLYACGLYLTSRIAPDAPSNSHDVILKSRWSGPSAAPNIVIVDIDERTLAALAPDHGRWPWPRSVLADGIQKLSELGMKALLFNVLISDPDKNDPDGDAAMEVTAALTRNAAFPVIRLNPENDEKSRLTVAALLAQSGDPVVNGSATVAVVRSLFETMHDRIGVANQLPDSDGVVRRYPVVWKDDVLTMPTIVARTVALAGSADEAAPQQIVLNWRNKNGRYRRVSFSDLLTTPVGADSLKVFKDAIVVLGVSAPGLGQTKATAVSAVEDDNEILATALDDVINASHLRTLPDWAVLAIELAAIWVLVWVGIGCTFSPILTKAFVLLQAVAGSITMLSASYTNHLVDLSGCMAFGAGVFTAIKLVQSLDSGWSRARPGLRRAAQVHAPGTVVIIGYRDSEVTGREAAGLQKLLEDLVGIAKVIRVDDLFGGENFIRPACEDFSCQIFLGERGSEQAVLGALSRQKIRPRLSVRDMPLERPWNPDDREFRKAIAPRLLHLCAEVIQQ